MRFSAAIAPYTPPRYVTSVTRRNSSGVMSSTGANTVAIALLTQISIGPNSRTMRSAASSSAEASATSALQTTASPPASSISRRVDSKPSSPRAINPTFAPRFANASAVARPTPAVAPVMTTTLFRNELVMRAPCDGRVPIDRSAVRLLVDAFGVTAAARAALDARIGRIGVQVGVAAVFAAVLLPGFDLTAAAFVPTALFGMIDFHFSDLLFVVGASVLAAITCTQAPTSKRDNAPRPCA